MKKLIALIIFGSISTAALALPVAFERNYTNYAWGYVNRGCFVDEHHFIYTYGPQATDQITMIGQVSAEEYQKGMDLLLKARTGTYTTKQAMFDAGITSWEGRLYGDVVKLRQSGDFNGWNSAPEANELANMIDTWCQVE